MKQKTKPQPIRQTIAFPCDLWKRIKQEASKKKLSVSDIVRLSVMDALPAVESSPKDK